MMYWQANPPVPAPAPDPRRRWTGRPRTLHGVGLAEVQRTLTDRALLDQYRVVIRERRDWTPVDDAAAADRFRDALIHYGAMAPRFRDDAAAANARQLLAARLEVYSTPTGFWARGRRTGLDIIETVEAAFDGDLAVLTIPTSPGPTPGRPGAFGVGHPS